MRYSQEFKDNVVARLLSKELSISEAVEQYSIGKSTISYWLRIAREQAGCGTLPNKGNPKLMTSLKLPKGVTYLQAHTAVVARESVRPARRIRSPKSAQRAREVNRFFSIFCKVSEKNGIGQRPTVCAMVRERAEPNLKDALSDRTVICASETQSVPEGTSFGLASCTLPFSDCFSL